MGLTLRTRFHVAARLVAALLILASSAISLRAQRADSYVFRKIQSALRDQGVELQARSFEYSLSGISIDLRGVSARAVGSDAKPPFFTADRIQAEITLRTLLGGTPRVTRATLARPSLRIVTDASGDSNLPSSTEPPSSPPSEELPAFLIDLLTGSNGEFVWDDRSRDLIVQAEGWKLRVTGNAATRTHGITLDGLRQGRITRGVRTLPIHDFSAKLALTGNGGLRVEGVDASIGHNRLHANGQLRNILSPDLNLDVEAEVSPGELLQMADLGVDTGGVIALRARLTGPLDKLNISGQLDGHVAGPELPLTAVNARWDANLADQVVRLDSLTLKSREGSANLRGTLTADSAGQSRLSVGLESVDLRQLARRLKLDKAAAATASAQVEASWPGLEFKLARAEGTLTLVPWRVPVARNLLPIGVKGSFDGQPGNLRIDLSNADALGVRLRGPIRLDSFASWDLLAQARIRASLAGSISDTGQTLLLVQRFLDRLPDGAPQPDEVAGRVDFSLRLAGLLPTPEATLKASSENLRLRNFDGLRVELEADATERRLDLRRLDLAWNQATAGVTATLPLSSARGPFEASANFRDFPLPPLLAALGQELQLDGQLEGDLRISGSLDQPQGEFRLLASRLSGYGQAPGALRLSGRLDGKTVRIGEAVFTQEGDAEPDGRASMSGFWDTESGRFQLEAQGGDLRIAPHPSLGDLSGVFDFQASGAGTLEDPGLEATLSGRRIVAGGNSVGTVSAELSVRDQAALLQLDIPEFATRLRGELSLLEPNPFRANAEFKQLDLAALPFQQPEGLRLTGKLSGSAQAAGDLREWRRSTAQLDIPKLLLNLNGREIGITELLKVRLENERLSVDASFESGESRLKILGDLPTDSESTGRIETSGRIDLTELEQWSADAGLLYLEGSAKLEGSITGNLAELTPDLRLTLDSATLAHDSLNSPLQDIGFDLTVSDGAVRLHRLRASLDSAVVEIDGELPFGLLGASLPLQSAPGPARLGIKLEGFSPSSLSAAPEGLTGTVSATLNARTEELAFGALVAEAEFDRLDFTLEGYRLAQTSPTRLSLRKEIASVENFTLAGPELNLRITGDTLFSEPRMYDLKINGDLDASVVSRFVADLDATGVTRLEAALAGPLDAPELNGFLHAADIDLRLRSPRIQGEALSLRLDFKGDRVEIGELSGQINGGAVTGSGGFRWAGLQPSNVALDLDAKEVFLNFPPGLRTLSDVSLRMRSRDDGVVLGGQVNVLDGSFSENIDLESRLLQLIRSGGPELPAEPNPFLERFGYDLKLNTVNPLLIDNNLARLELNVDLSARGTFYRPGLTGNINLEEGGELFLREKTYIIDRGTVLLLDQTRIAPTLDILARTKAGRYDITLKISGPPDDLNTDFTSDPPLPEPDIIAVLITGRTLDELRGSEANVAKEQTLSYLTGTFGSRLGSEAEKALGLSKVRIEPNLIAPESSPSARLTIGEDLTRDLRLIYSTNLVDSGDQIYIAEYDITRRFLTRGIKQADNTYRFEFNHDLRFGGTSASRSASDSSNRRKIGEIQFQGETFFTPEELRKKLKLKQGQTFDFFAVRKGVDRLEEWYRKNDLLESRVRLQREARNGATDLNFSIRPGPRVRFEFSGDPISDKLRRTIAEVWADGVFDAQRAADASQLIREDWVRRGHLQPKVEHEVEHPSADEKTVRFQIQAGPRYKGVEIEFPGASGISPETLRERIEEADLFSKLIAEPALAVEFLTTLYRTEGYLSARVETPDLRISDDGSRASVVVSIQEGPAARVASVGLQGNRILDDQTLLAAIPLKVDGPYRPALRQNSRQALLDLYWARGYNDVQVTDSVRVPKPGDPFQVLYEIREGRKGVVREIRAEGFNRTSEPFILRQLEIAPGDPLIFEQLSRSRKRLYDTGAYSLVEIDSEPIEEAQDDENKPVRLKIRVRELAPYELRYGGFYDTDRGLGLTADFRNRNSLGSARVVGARTRYDGDVREMRGYFSQPALKNLPLKTTVDGFVRREIRPDFITDRQGVSFQQEANLRDRFVFSYGYRFERNDTFERDPDPIFGFDIPPFNVAALTTTLTRDTRDDILDATRGTFTSLALEYAPDFVGSDLQFIRFFGQHYRYYALSKPEEIPWSGGEKQPRLVFASGVRVGLAKGLAGQILVPSERFFAGGGTSIRGFEQDAIGQDTDLFGGGDALFIVNTELRFPIFNIFDGVAFIDVGNVYAGISDFDPFDVRSAAGLGLRVRTPYFLLRLDYGFKLDRQAGESQGEFFFSIGQAF